MGQAGEEYDHRPKGAWQFSSAAHLLGQFDGISEALHHSNEDINLYTTCTPRLFYVHASMNAYCGQK